MPSRPVLIGRGLVTQTLNQNDKAQTNNYMFASTNHTQDTTTVVGVI